MKERLDLRLGAIFFLALVRTGHYLQACSHQGGLSVPPASPQHRFSLDKDTGLIVLIARLDFELIQRFTLTVIARDGGGEETTGRVRINVLDVNDNVPTFQKDAYVGALRENEPSVTQLVRLRVRARGPVVRALG